MTSAPAGAEVFLGDVVGFEEGDLVRREEEPCWEAVAAEGVQRGEHVGDEGAGPEWEGEQQAGFVGLLERLLEQLAEAEDLGADEDLWCVGLGIFQRVGDGVGDGGDVDGLEEGAAHPWEWQDG